jgi:hypothetical protein
MLNTYINFENIKIFLRMISALIAELEFHLNQMNALRGKVRNQPHWARTHLSLEYQVLNLQK